MNFFVACISAAVISFSVVFIGGFILIPHIHKEKFVQTASRNEGFVCEKTAVPAMGGILFTVSTLFSFAVIALFDKLRGGNIVFGDEITGNITSVKLISGLVSSFGFAFIGFVDDYIKIKNRHNLGLKASQKSFMQILLCVMYLLTLFINDPTGSIFIPFCGMIETRALFWVIGLPLIYCTVNAAALTDGTDGLCTSVTFTAALSFAGAAVLRKCFGAGLLASSLAGGLSGFLIWNSYPAKVKMGGTGSMFLGGMVICLAYSLDMPLIIFLSGIVYVIEFLSNIVQVVYFKLTHGKKLLKTAPLHRHLELCGKSERKIVRFFTLTGFFGGILSLLLIYFGNLR